MEIQFTINCFLEYIETERRLSIATLNVYQSELERFRDYLAEELGITEIESVDTKSVREWQASLMDKGLSPNSIKRALSALSSWFKYLRQQHMVSTDIMAKIAPPKTPKRLPIFYREQELEKIYTQDDLFPDTFEGKRDKLLLQILYETGIRRAEIAGLKESSIDFSSHTIKVLGKRDKERIIPIENELAHNISEYLTLKRKITELPELFLITKKGKPMNEPQIYQVVKKYMTTLSNAPRISPHIFRHSFATHMLNEGADINALKELLGHSDIAATEVYTHVTREHLKDTYKHAHPRSSKKKE